MSIIADDNDFENENSRVEIKKNPVIKAESIEFDKNFESCIRPKSFDTYIGQSALKDTLKITIAAAKKESCLWIIYFFTDLPDWVKQLLQALLQNKWALKLKSHPLLH